MKFLPTERAMGLVTLLSGLAIPVGLVLGAGAIGVESQAVNIFEFIMWLINPFGMWAFKGQSSLLPLIALYIIGTMFSALLWGYLDALIFRKKRSREPSQ